MKRLMNKAMDPISFETHFIGAIFSVLALICMLIEGLYKHTSLPMMIATFIFGLSLILLYSASSMYHFCHGSDQEPKKSFLRKLDHSMIFVLIVGTYTPVVTYCMQAPRSYIFLGILWSIALLGVIQSIFWINAPRALTTLLYLALGWAVLFDFQSFASLPGLCLQVIAAGGIAYSIGAVIYIIKKPNISQAFGFHELFHIFVMMGSLLHYIAIVVFLF